MKTILFLLLLLPAVCFSQKSLDTKIIVSVSDPTGLYEKVRISFVNNEFIVKDNRNPDTLTTYAREVKPIGYVLAQAVISGNKVTLSGILSTRKINMLGYTVMPGPADYKKIYYYKRDKAWLTLANVAAAIKGEITYSK